MAIAVLPASITPHLTLALRRWRNFPVEVEGMADEANIEAYRRALDAARREAPNGSEYWLARDLQGILNYLRWENFEAVIEKAQMACASTGVSPDNHFRPTHKMVAIGSGTHRKIDDWFLSRYACYLIAMNGNPQLPQVAFAQQYFAVQTRLREQEIESLGYDRVAHRLWVSQQIKALNSAAKKSGVQNYAVFHDAGYRGLYGGLGKQDLKRKKRISENEELLDCAGRAELAANEFKATQTEQKLIRDQVVGEKLAVQTHHAVGVEVREAIRRIGGTMPEDLPAEESIKKLAAKRKRKLIPRLS